MLNHLVIIYIFFLLIFIGCKTKDKNTYTETEIIPFNINNLKSDFDLTSLINDKFEIIYLETNDKCLIGNIDALHLKNDIIYIVDKMSASIFFFDYHGKFIKKINNRGYGKGYYINISDVVVTDQSIIIGDIYSQKQLFYDLQGNFENELLISDIWYRHLFIYNDHLYYVNDWSNSNVGRYRLFSLDINKKDHFNKYLPFKNVPNGLRIKGPVHSKSPNGISLIYSNCDIVYQISENEIKPLYNIDFKEQKLIFNVNENLREILLSSPENKVVNINALYENNKFLFLEIFLTGPSPISYIIYNKQDKSTLLVNGHMKISKYGNIFTNIKHLENNKIVHWENPDDFILLFDYNYSKEKYQNESFKQRLYNVRKNVKSTDNPILFIYELKEENNYIN